MLVFKIQLRGRFVLVEDLKKGRSSVGLCAMAQWQTIASGTDCPHDTTSAFNPLRSVLAGGRQVSQSVGGEQ